MNAKLEYEINSEEEINLYDYWKVFVKRKKIFLGIFLIPFVTVTIISLSLPRYYRGEGEISYPASLTSPASPVLAASPAANIVKLIGVIDEARKVKIFTKNSDAIKNVSVSLTKGSADKVTILVDAKTADIIPQAFKGMVDYISNMPELNEENAKIKEENNFKMKHLIEAKKENLIFLGQITDMMKKRQISLISVNPADLIKKDADLYLEIMNLQKIGANFGLLGPLSISVQPSNLQIKQRIVITGLLSLFTGILAVFFLEYIDRIKVRENNQRRLP